MIVRVATDDDVRLVIAYLRRHCVEELLSTRWTDDRDALAADICRMAPIAMVRAALCARNGEPVSIFGAYRTGPAVAAIQMFSTDAWPMVARPCLRWFLRTVAPALDSVVAITECSVLAVPDIALDWFAFVGFHPAGVAQPRGRQGQEFIPMVRRRPTVDTPRRGLPSRRQTF